MRVLRSVGVGFFTFFLFLIVSTYKGIGSETVFENIGIIIAACIAASLITYLAGGGKNEGEKKQLPKENVKGKPKTLQTDQDRLEKSKLTIEEIDKIKSFEAQWSEKVKQSSHIEVPSIGKRLNGVVEDLIQYRGVRSLKADKNGFHNIKENSLKKEMLEVEKSLIDRFLLNNEYFIPGNKVLYFLTDKERNTFFTHYKDKYGAGTSSRSRIKIGDRVDFISIDRKILSLNKDLYFLDWPSQIYFGFDSDLDEEWDSIGGRDEILNLSFVRHNIFTLPPSMTMSKIEDLYFPVIEHNDMDYFPSEWTSNNRFNVFMNSINTLLSFSFREKLIKRTEELYRIIEYRKELKQVKEKNQVKVELEKIDTIFDINGNGQLEVAEVNGYLDLLNHLKDDLKEKGKDYVHDLIKLKSFTEQKRENLNSLYKILKSVETHRDFNFYVDVLKNEISIYQKFIFHSMSMITFLIQEDKFSFYEIYEIFDELNVFDSKWERDLSGKLSSINIAIKESGKSIEGALKEINNSIYSHTIEINEKLDKLTYTTNNSIKVLTDSMNTRLKSINSTIDANNLLTAINTYQLYKINKNTRSLRG